MQVQEDHHTMGSHWNAWVRQGGNGTYAPKDAAIH
jgi:hypothetical protein